MARVPNGVKILPKISIAWVGCTNVTDRRQTDKRPMTYSEHELEFTFAKNEATCKCMTKLGLLMISKMLIVNLMKINHWLIVNKFWLKTKHYELATLKTLSHSSGNSAGNKIQILSLFFIQFQTQIVRMVFEERGDHCLLMIYLDVQNSCS